MGYFVTGALAGGLSAGVGMGVTASLSGASFGAGFMGTQTAMSAISASFTTSFISGAAIGGASGFASGFVAGTGNAWLGGEKFGQGLWSGTLAGLMGGISGGLTGGLAGGIKASIDGRDFWTGSNMKVETIFDQSNILPKVEQVGTNNCLPTAGEVVDKSYGMNIDQQQIRNNLFPGTSAESDMLYDGDFWDAFSRQYAFTNEGESYSPASIIKAADYANKGGRITVGIGSHQVNVASLKIKAIYRNNGTKLKFVWKVLDNGIIKTVRSSDFGNMFFIRPDYNRILRNINLSFYY